MTEQQFEEFNETIISEAGAAGLLHSKNEVQEATRPFYTKGFIDGAAWVLLRLQFLLTNQPQPTIANLIRRTFAYDWVKRDVKECEIIYTRIDHADEGQSLPEENETVSWWYKSEDGDGCPPYVGTMLDDDFPGVACFFAWSTIPEPPTIFFETYNFNW